MSSFSRTNLTICILLVLLTSAVFWGITGNGFINYDDIQYIQDNRHVNTGLTKANVVWAFTSIHASNWHPLTWLSHMVDVELFGLNPHGHHFMGLLFHAANTSLLLLLLVRLTGVTWRSAMVAALFAIHPLHVESVAWAAERKDLLSTNFGFISMLFYVSYVKQKRLAHYFAALFCFTLGLMSKPMLVTLPFILLLLDYWPLCRFGGDRMEPHGEQDGLLERESCLRLVFEKVPFFVLSAVSCVITFYAQRSGGAMASLTDNPLSKRLASALVAYLGYLGKTFWPHDLAVLYPLPHSVPLWQPVGAVSVLLVITALALAVRRQHPFVVVGWLWFIGTLVPVIGLVQVGLQSMADRYMYVPIIGILVMLVWGISDLTEKWPYRRTVLTSAASVAIFICAVVSWQQVRFWNTSRTLFSNLAVTNSSFMTHYLLGITAYDEGKTVEAIAEYKKALALNPDYVDAHVNLGIVLGSIGNLNEAVRHFNIALQFNPDLVEGHYNLALALEIMGKADEAIKHYYEVLRIDPEYAESHNNLGVALLRLERIDEANWHFSQALRIRPDFADALQNMNMLLKQNSTMPDRK